MSVKSVRVGIDARLGILRGVKMVARTVAVTLGPKGRNVLVAKSHYEPPVVTKDGVTVAKEIDLADRFENMGAQMVKEAAAKTSLLAGDGTTTATIMAAHILAEGLRLVAAGHAPIDLKRGIVRAVDVVLVELQRISRPVRGRKDLERVATISANGDETVGRTIAEAMDRVGKEGIVAIEEGRTRETTMEIIEGMDFDRGFVSPYFVTDPLQHKVKLEDCLILVCGKKLTATHELVPLLEGISRSGKSFLVIAESIEGEVLTALIVNKMRGVLKCAAVRAPSFGERQKELLEDIAAVTGTRVVSEESGMKLEAVKPSQLGRAKKVFIDRENTTIVGGAGLKGEIQARAERIRRQIPEASEYDREKLEDRLAKLVGGVAIIRAGGFTEIEMKERRARMDDAACAARAAVEEGIVPGGGVALLRAVAVLDSLRVPEEQRPGVFSVRRAIEEPARWIARNAGWDPAVVIGKLDGSKGAHGFNAATGRFEDLAKSGVIDATKVVRIALQMAASVAISALMTETAIAEKVGVPEKDYLDPPVPDMFK